MGPVAQKYKHQAFLRMTTDLERLCTAAWEGPPKYTIEQFRAMLASLDIEEINKQNSRGQSALYCAARRNHKAFVLALLQLEGINVNCQARTHGSTPLHG